MSTILIGNIISFSGAILMVTIGLLKTRKQILTVQSIQFALMGIGNYILGGVTGAVSNGLSILRNLYCLKKELSMPLRIAFVAVQITLTAVVNQAGIIGWLPVVAAASLTMMINTKNEIQLKTVIIFGQLCWVIFDISIQNYAGVVFDILTVVTNFIAIVKLKKGAVKAT